MHRLKFWLTNRVVIGLVVFFTLIGFWEFRWKPQYRGFYEQGVVYYQAGQYQEALTEFNTAYNIAPNAVDVLMMQGWVNLKLKRYEEARMFFDRVLRIDPRVEEARMGAGFVALDTGRGDIDFTVLAKYLGKRSADPNVAILIAGSLVKEGKNREAADIYLHLLNNRDYGKAAHEALSAMLGTTVGDEKPSIAFADTPRPAQLQANYRAADGAMWTKSGNGWQKYYVAGMNLGPGAPGYYPGSPPTEPHYYADWIENAERMNANTLRVYTLLPPSFYRAFKAHTRSGGKVRLYQQVWVGDPPNKDLYDPKFVEDTKAEIRYVVDAIHGQGDIPLKYARGSGLYIDDVSADVSAILLGRELEASTAIQTNIINGGKQKYDGKYFSPTPRRPRSGLPRCSIMSWITRPKNITGSTPSPS
jgi:Tfp pilus assembly protein PilF